MGIILLIVLSIPYVLRAYTVEEACGFFENPAERAWCEEEFRKGAEENRRRYEREIEQDGCRVAADRIRSKGIMPEEYCTGVYTETWKQNECKKGMARCAPRAYQQREREIKRRGRESGRGSPPDMSLRFALPRVPPPTLPLQEAPAALREFVRKESLARQVPPKLVEAMIAVESKWNPRAVSPKGAYGLMQLMPETAAYLGVNRYDVRENIIGGIRYLKEQLDRFKNLEFALAAYNAGPEAVVQYGAVPPFPETKQYVRRVVDVYAALMKPLEISQVS